MAEVVLFNLAKEILLKLGSTALQQVGLAWGVKKELRKLENKISTIRNVLLSAEEEQMRNPAVKGWLQRLKLVFYDADDLLDEVATETLRRQMKTHKSMVREVCYFFTSSNTLAFHYVLGRNIKDIAERLDEIVAEMRDFKFVVKVAERPIEIKRRDDTSSLVHIPEVTGRDTDKEALIKLLLSSSDDNNFHIIPIVGMGGLGKTTLAQLVYNDDRIQNHFSTKMWVCVSDDFDMKRILIKLLEVVGDNGCNNEGIEHLQIRVRRVLSDNKFFLVLDDVWNENRVQWKKLQDLFAVGASGSRILVTTRSKMVASIVRTMEPYELEGLSDEDCLRILVKWAFEEGEENKHQNLVNIGREIVKKCGGVPLAARTLGAMLFMKTNDRDWFFVRNNEIWSLVKNENDILPILRLSYDQMPSYLKQCFAYCSLFVKDQIIFKQELIYGWMAHGFIQSSDKDEELEDIGEEYIEELARRSFLQPDSDLAHDRYKMHDLVHDLAQYVAGNERLTVKGENIVVIPERVRHVSFDSSLYTEFPKHLIKAKKLRTMFLPSETGPNFGSSVEEAIPGFRCLRVLNFGHRGLNFYPRNRDIHVLPKEIGNLDHLRYLTCSDVEKLPRSLCKLLNLQYLDLYGSTLDQLPEDFGNLINLRFLCLSSNLTCLPEKGIGGLTSLRIFLLLVNGELRSLGDGIQNLTCLRELVIWGCPKLTSLLSGVKHLTSLKHLEIRYCQNLELSEEYDLKGLKSLKKLVLNGLPKLVSLPKGLNDSADTLNHLHLSFCKNLTTLSESVLPNLGSLQVLEIRHCHNRMSLPQGMQRLAALRRLRIVDCFHLSRRCEEGIGEDWPKIAHVPDSCIQQSYHMKRSFFDQAFRDEIELSELPSVSEFSGFRLRFQGLLLGSSSKDERLTVDT
ncbi:putative disease resistance protein RGA4 isoform X1 [Rhododendron vialii]|uniref:putative disease resistance protein RGA4 isoform X1 n=1 Tax=Rhododendron vialii TaxID=182163 RepID=UPI00265D7DB5|nr:putative disease resistance protein RGA4 isoform X1 [Rhododendron vialii]